ncbi:MULTISPECIES: hypothetical protein [Haloarcula]|uniref:Uncharacterized protein n=2 Tax=Haloarcula sebkhae TaxID=932660 RepID=A0ACC6VR27_9EURY|nr:MULTISPECIES: hypothetical protein [Haloarcula]GGK79804.1 hypothetical protein GCM10009067_35190 [Haloarcula sebkhae]
MIFLEDTRAQSVQIGAVLLFGILVISFSLHQAVIVPNQNRDVEFNHFTTAQNEMEILRNEILNAGQDGDASQAPVQLGTSYPPRMIAAQPQRSSGSLRVRSIGGDSKAFELQEGGTPSTQELCGLDSVTTGAATYQPNYNYLDSVKNITYENTVTYTNGRSESRSFQTDQQLVQNTTVHLYPLVGESDQGGSSVASVTVEGNETGFKSVSGSFSLVVPTRLSATEWEQLLSEQTHVSGVESVSGQAVKINFDNSDYNLKCSPVGVGERPDNNPAYVKNNDGNQNGGGTAYNISWVDTRLVPGPTEPSEVCPQFPCNVTLRASTDPTQIGAPVGFGSGDGNIATVQERLNVTGRAGASQTNVTFNRAVGNTTLWTQSGGAKDSLVVSTPSSADFESGLGEYSKFGSFEGNDADKRDNTQQSNSGEWAVLLDGGSDGGIKTTGYDTTGGESVIIQYWVVNSDRGTPDGNGQLVAEYLSKDGNWVEADSKLQERPQGSDSAEIRTVRLGEAAIHDNFGLRFKQVDADNPNDEWLIDDPTITVLGTKVAPGAADMGGGGDSGGGPPGFSSLSATNVPSSTVFGSQTFTFTLNKSLANGETVTINFDEAQGLKGGGNEFPDPADYRSAEISDFFSSLSDGTATIAATEGTVRITYQANQDISTGTTIEIVVYDVDTEGQSTDTVSATFSRSDGTTGLTTFSVD